MYQYILNLKTTLLAFLLLSINLIYGQCPSGDVILNSQTEVDNFISVYPNCDTISGDLIITGSVNNLSTLDYLVSIEGDFIITGTQLTTISNFDSLVGVLTIIEFSENAMLTEIEGFNALIDLGTQFKIQNNPNLISIDGFINATDVFGDYWISDNASLQTINGFGRLVTIRDFLALNDNPVLTSIPSFNNLNYVGWGIQFYNTGLIDIEGFDNLTSIGGVDPTLSFGITNNPNLVSVSGFNCLETIVFDLLIQDNPVLQNINGISNLQSVGQFFTIRNNASLTTLNGLQNLNSVSTSNYETTVTFEIHDNPSLTDCDPLCNLLSSNGIIGLTNINNNATGCDSETEIETTNCLPFAGINCTSLISPLNGDIDVAVDTNLSWNPIAGATSYSISIGTTPEGAQIANNINVGNITTYDILNNLPENTEIFVKIKPNNANSQAKCCIEESFITEAIIPECSTLTDPINGSTNVSIATSINWQSSANAIGYVISIGTFAGGTDILDQLDVDNITSFYPNVNFTENTTLFVTITPYNTSGSAIGCTEESFTTQLETLDCTSLLSPLNGAIDVSNNTMISWSATANAIGYFLSIGSTLTSSDIINNQNVGNVTTFILPESLPISSQVYVKIIPYNDFGEAIDCQTESFTTTSSAFFVPQYFTPNNDGANETWVINDPLNEINVVYIYNRYGKLLKSFSNLQQGWTGDFNNQKLPTNDYWYVIKLNNGVKVSGHFSLKR